MKTRWLILVMFIAFFALVPALDAVEKRDIGSIWHAIMKKQEELGNVIKEKKLNKVHETAFAVRDLAKLLPEQSKNLSAENQKKLKSWVDGIADSARKLDIYGDGNDQSNTEKEAKRLNTLLKSIEKLYPPDALKYDGKSGQADDLLKGITAAKGAEPHDQGDPHAGHNSKQEDHGKDGHDDSHGDHAAKQGGILGMQGDYHYELVDRGKEFRVYLYDAFTKPMPVKGAKGSIEVEVQSGKTTTLSLSAAADGSYLYALKPKGIDPDEVTLSLNLPKEEIVITLLLRTSLSFKGRVVDIACFVKNGAAALESSDQCSRKSTAAGSPVGILHGNDITAPLYMAVFSGKDSSFRSANEKLLSYLNKQVNVTGRLMQRNKIEVIEIIDIKAVE